MSKGEEATRAEQNREELPAIDELLDSVESVIDWFNTKHLIFFVVMFSCFLLLTAFQNALTESGYAPSTISSSIGRLQTFLEVALKSVKRSIDEKKKEIM